MKKLLTPVLLVIVLLNLPACLNLSIAQDTLKIRLKSDAMSQFSSGNYGQSLILYRELLNAYPKEPEYQYCVGVCQVKTNGDLKEAIRLLRPVQVAEYNPLALYYLGRALHLFYSFEDAVKAYSKFMVNGKRSDIRKLQVERLIEMAKNGQDYTRSGYPVNVQNVEPIPSDQLQYASNINGSGKLMKKPVEFCNKTDVRNGYRPWMFLPSYTEVNEYVYIAGYEAGKKNNKQLFRIKNLNHETWGPPEPLNQVINTQYDEEFPFFDVKTSTLYFSSDGHSSMGGYDIFRSVYDWNSKSWSRPENLGFPINSPYDDYVYITDQFSHSASFVSSRNSEPGKVNIYRIRLQQDTSGIRFISVDDIRKASMLQVEVASPVAQPDINQIAEIKPDSLSMPISRSNYKKILAEALFLQIKADSAARITRDLRILAKEAPNNSSKKQMIADILKNDKAAKSFQREADARFAEARKIRKYSDTTDTIINSPVVFDKEINGIAIYKYNNLSTDNLSETESRLTKEENETEVTQDVVAEVKKDDFGVLDSPVYNDNNPIPQGIKQLPGLIYRIQLGVFSKEKPNDAFGGIFPVAFEQPEGTSILKYYAGVFYSSAGVAKALELVRSKGFTDAFVVAFMDGKLITTEKAREIEFAEFNL